jgi:uncharacterized protein with ATP-grasp and redox domains
LKRDRVTPPHIPPPRVDPAALPPVIRTSEPGSFAHNTLAVRVPAILRATQDSATYPPDIHAALDELHAELTGGVIRKLHEAAPDAAFWNATAAAHLGRSWLDVPWYWAEAFFYRRMLEAVRYFQPGPWQGVDPYAPTKRREWAAEAAPAAVGALLEALPDDVEERFETLLHASLWGNRTDLSYMVAAHLGATGGPDAERANLLVDDAALVWRHLLRHSEGRADLLADNAGTELLMDVALADFLLLSGLAAEVHFHLKPWPFFVSDAMPADLVDGLDALLAAGGAGAKLARRVDGHLTAGALSVSTHWFNASSLFHYELPDDLYAGLSAADLVIVKGDANYRRLLGDAHWPFTTPFADVVGYFPAPVVSLRTLKSEVAVGLATGQAERLAGEDPAWLVNGRRGLIQFAENSGA